MRNCQLKASQTKRWVSFFFQIRPQQAQAQVTAVGEQKGNPDRKTKTKGEQNTYHKVSFLVHYNETMLKFHFMVKNYLQTNETLFCFVLQPHLLILILKSSVQKVLNNTHCPNQLFYVTLIESPITLN